MKISKDLLLSFVNATIMLIVILLICMIVLVGKVTNLRDSTAEILAEKLKPQTQRLTQVVETVESLDARLKAGTTSNAELAQIKVELQHLNTQISDIRTAVQQPTELSVNVLASHVLQTMADSLKQ